MASIITLIAKPGSAALSNQVAMRCASIINSETIRWLAEDEALDLIVPSEDYAELHSSLARTLAGTRIDIAIQNDKNNRVKKILIADMDSTMIQQECIDELAAEAGIKDHVAEITKRAMNGEIDFNDALRERVLLLKGLSIDVIDRVLATRIQLMPGGVELVKTMRKNGAYCALVSGGFSEFTNRVAQMLGFQENRANILSHADGLLTGAVREPILGMQAKVDALNDISGKLGLSPSDAIAVGDGANDLGMLGHAGLGVALHAKPAVAVQADIRIDHGDLTSLLYLQGYSAADIAR